MVFGQYLAEPVCGNQFAIGEVGDDLADAPLARRNYEILFLPENASQDHGEEFGTAAESFQ
jgi:hypothetical protein